MKTVIVGAGLAGLAIADKLLAAGTPGRQIVVLEKYDYIGGRVVTGHRAGLTYEIGAGRVHNRHRRVAALIRRFHLHTDPLSPHTDWRQLGAHHSEYNHFEESWGVFLTQVERLPPSVLAASTLAQLARRILGARAARSLLDRYAYRAEVERMRADVAIRGFRAEMGTRQGFYVVREGLSAIVERWVTELKRRGVRFETGAEVTDVTRKGSVYTVLIKGREEPVYARRVILALHASALCNLPVLRDFAPLRHVEMSPLIRIYAQYPVPPRGGAAWFAGMPHTVTDSPLRNIIPINPDTGLIMISYTDDRDTHVWENKNPEALTAAVQTAVRQLFPELHIPDPLWLKAYPWTDGCTYWEPGAYDPVEESQKALHPLPETMPELYICNESFSLRQAWMEGALEHAEALGRLLVR